MSRILFTCAYDGAPWRGWQSQTGGITVQDCLQDAFSRILQTPQKISAAGRTDAGVHALGQCFHADVPDCCRMSCANWVAALNANLPTSVRILAAQPVASDFHARFSAVGKTYEYRIYRGTVLPPHEAGRMWHMVYPMEVSLLREALQSFCGEHDFHAFCARRGNEPNPLPSGYFCRTIFSAIVLESSRGDVLSLRVHGNGFLYRMVRIMVGSACRVACGRMPLEQLADSLSNTSSLPVAFCAPPDGLYLLRVDYPFSTAKGTIY